MGSQTINKIVYAAYQNGSDRIYHDYVIETDIGGAIRDKPYYRVTATYSAPDCKFLTIAQNNQYHEDTIGTRYAYKNGAGDTPKDDCWDRYGVGLKGFYLSAGPGVPWDIPINVVISAKWGDTPEDVADCEPWAKSVKVTLFANVDGTIQASKKTVGLSDSGETQVNFDYSDFGLGATDDFALYGVRVYNDTSARLPDGFGYRVNLKVTKQMTPVNFFESIFTGLTTGDYGDEDYQVANSPLYDGVGFKSLDGRRSQNVKGEFFPTVLREVQVILNKVSYTDEPVCPAPIEPDKPDEEFQEEYIQEVKFPPIKEPVELGEPVEPVQPVEPSEPIEPIEPTEPTIIIKGEDDECCEKTIEVLNAINLNIYNCNLALLSRLDKIEQSFNLFRSENLNLKNIQNDIAQKMLNIELYKLFLQQDDVRENSESLSEILQKISDDLNKNLSSQVDTEQSKGIADIISERDTIQFIDYPIDVLSESSTTKKL